MADELVTQLRAISGAVRRLETAVAYLRHDSYKSVNGLLSINRQAHLTLRRAELGDSAWHDDAMRFLLQEAVHCEGETANWGYEKVDRFDQAAQIQQRSKVRALASDMLVFMQRYGERQAWFHALPVSAVIVTALPEEFRAVLRRAAVFVRASRRTELMQALWEVERPSAGIGSVVWVECGIEREGRAARVMVVCASNYGPAATQAAMQQVIEEVHVAVQHVFVVGIAGHLDGGTSLGLGDIVLSDGLYDARLRKRTADGEEFISTDLIPYPIEWPFDLNAWRPAQKLISSDLVHGDPVVAVGPVVSGFEVVKADEYKATLQRSFPGALAVEMEAAGCMTAVERFGSPVTVVKALSDWSNGTKNSRLHAYAADIAADLAEDVILQLYGTETGRGDTAPPADPS